MPGSASYCQTDISEQFDVETQAPNSLCKAVDAIIATETEDEILKDFAELVEASRLDQLRSYNASVGSGHF